MITQQFLHKVFLGNTIKVGINEVNMWFYFGLVILWNILGKLYDERIWGLASITYFILSFYLTGYLLYVLCRLITTYAVNNSKDKGICIGIIIITGALFLLVSHVLYFEILKTLLKVS